MKKLFGLTFFVFFLSLSSAYAQQGSSGGGPSLGNGTFSVMNPHEVRDFRDSMNSLRIENPFLVKIDESKVEALTTHQGDYARLEDIREGFVHFKGVEIRKNFIYFDPLSLRSEIYSAILKNGQEVKPSQMSPPEELR